MRRGKQGTSWLSVEVSGLQHSLFVVSDPADDDFEEEIMLSNILFSKTLPNLKEVVVPSKPTNQSSLEATDLRSLKLWKEAREVLEGIEMVKSGKVKLRTFEVGETGE